MTYPGMVKTVLIGQESAWGTAVTADKDVGLVQEISDNFTREIKETGAAGSIQTQKVTSGMFDPGSSITVDFQHGRLLEYALGAVAHLETTGDWTHTFTVSNTPPSFTLESGNNLTTDTVLTGAGFLAETTELSIALNENLKIKIDVKGKTTTSSASAGAAVISALTVFPHALCSVSIGGSPETEVQNFSIKINSIVDRSGGVGSNLYQQGHVVEMKFEFSGTLGFADKDLQELYLGGSTPSATSDPSGIAVVLAADNGTALGSGERSMDFALQSCIMSTFDEVATLGGLTFVDIVGAGIFNTCTSVDNIASAAW